MMEQNIRIAMAQINLCVGDIDGNQNLIIEALQSAREQQSDVVIFPELALTAYSPEDLLFRSTLHAQINQALQEICAATHGIDVIVGYPLLIQGRLFNSCSLIRDGQVSDTYHKQSLPNYAVFDEKRYFNAGNEPVVFDLNGITVALSICEDIWQPDLCRQVRALGSDFLININASPYQRGKLAERAAVLKARALESELDIIYVNLVGGQDELVFDGGSMAVNHIGKVIFQAEQFTAGIYLVNYAMSHQDRFFVDDDYQHHPRLSEEESIYRALVLGVQDYVHKNGFTSVVLGLSGGIDSALTLCIAVDAVGADNVEVLLMPSQYTATMSNEDAQCQAKKLGVRFTIIPIESVCEGFNHLLEAHLAEQCTELSKENIQARCRAILLMAIANNSRKLLLATGNKSELAVGYTTLYGDMAGGFAPLKDITKTMVYSLANWRNDAQQIIPQRVIDRPPSAELRQDQKDEDDLPSYAVLDKILEKYVELNQSPAQIIASGFSAEVVKKVIGMVDKNEYKRRQSPLGVKISKCAFGRDRRYPVAGHYRASSKLSEQ